MKARLLPIALLIATQSCFATEQPAAKLISEIEGVYKYRHTTLEYNGGKPEIPHQVEDIMEIVRYDATHIYFRTDLYFHNGHTCEISGIAEYADSKFDYQEHDPQFPDQDQCAVQISKSDSHIHLKQGERNSCSWHCGVRGSLRDVEFVNSSKRKIRYLPLIQSSRQYKAAVTEFENLAKSKSKSSSK